MPIIRGPLMLSGSALGATESGIAMSAEAITGIRGRGLAMMRRARGLRFCREQVAYCETLF